MRCGIPKLAILAMSAVVTTLCIFPFINLADRNGDVPIYLIRHAEKPVDTTDPHLSAAGWYRAYCLADYFAQPGFDVSLLAAPGNMSEATSLRPIETVQPLARRLSLAIDVTCHYHQIQCVVTHIRRNPGKVLLLSWTHEEIPAIAAACGVSDIPRWEGYDKVWVIHGHQLKVLSQPANCTMETYRSSI